MAAGEEEEQAARGTFASLPLSLALNVFARLPADARARAACVCPTWRTTADEVSLWTRLDLSRASGVTCTVNAAALCGAAAKARGGLTALDVSGCSALVVDHESTALLAVVAANAGTLRGLRAYEPADDPLFSLQMAFKLETVEALLRAAPLLHACELSISCGARAAPPLLRNTPPFGLIRAYDLHISWDAPANFAERYLAWAAVVLAVRTAWTNSQSLRFLHLTDAPLHTPAELDAVVGAALSRRLPGLGLSGTRLGPAFAPALARLLGSSTLQTLHITAPNNPLLDAPAAAVLADALRANSTLTSLALCHCSLFDNPAAAATLLGALTAHPSLRRLDCSFNACRAHAEVGAALGALVAANAPALRELRISFCTLNDLSMGPLVDALPSNTHLRMLDCSGFNNLSAAFVRDRLLPSARANHMGLRIPTAYMG
jgi:hypothetical protein